MAANNWQAAAENAVGHPAPAPAPAPAARQKRSVWTGVRFRQGGRWAAEIRVPRTHERIWIGVFETEREAALAYDAAIFCFFGENPPPPRKFNFPAAPRPDVADDVLANLTVADIKDIAKKHAVAVAGLLPPPASTAAEPAAAALNPNPVDVDLSLGRAANGSLNAADGMVFVSKEEFVAGDY